MPRRLFENFEQRVLRAETHFLRVAENDDAHGSLVGQNECGLPQITHRVHGKGARILVDHRDVGVTAVFGFFAGGTHAAGALPLAVAHRRLCQEAGKRALAAAGRPFEQQSMRKTPCRNIL